MTYVIRFKEIRRQALMDDKPIKDGRQNIKVIVTN